MNLRFLPVWCLSLAGYAQVECSAEAAMVYQKELDAFYSTPMESPLTNEDLHRFSGLPFFPVSEQYQVQARLEVTPATKPFGMKTTTQRMPMYRQYGVLHFELHGQQLQLPVYQSAEATTEDRDLFVPFTDLTNGKTSYKGGRYVEVQIPETGTTLCLDFNRAYNPYCAYNPRYSCPVVPDANHLPVAVEAGVQLAY